MGCCRNLLSRSSNHKRSVLCYKWVLPLRILILAALAGVSFFAVTHAATLSPLVILFLILFLVFAGTVFKECDRSVRYHKTLKAENHEENRRL